MTRPGAWLRTVASRVYAKDTMDRVIDPIVADIQKEHDAALRAGQRWRASATCARGYINFWKAIGLHAFDAAPRTLANAVAADGWALGRTIAYSVMACMGITLLLSADPMVESYARLPRLTPALLLLPQAIVLSIPIALSLAIVWTADRMHGGATRIRRVLATAIAATVLAFFAMAMLPAANDAWQIAMAEAVPSLEITQAAKGMNEMSFSELASAISANEASGSSTRAALLRRAYHMRFALPAATLVLSLLALSICTLTSMRSVRLLALVLSFGAYYMILALTESGPLLARLPAVFSVWSANVLLAAASLFLLRQRTSRA
jgi:Lipopolysaccharide export system permease LptF/LptG